MQVFPVEPQKTCHQWYLARLNIDFEPSYQRKSGLWPEKNQVLLINSILNGYDVPKIYLADFSFGSTSLQEKRKIYAIVDGKQRLTTIFKFFDDELALDSTPILHNGKEIVATGATYSTLKSLYSELADKIEHFQMSMMSVISDDEREIHELFVRLNLNVSISGPEIRNAMPGPVPQLIRIVSLHRIFSSRIKFSTNRGQDFNAIAKLLLIESREDFHTLGKARLDKFVLDNIGKPYHYFDKIEKEVVDNLDFMTKVFRERDNLLKSQNTLIVYYEFLKNRHGSNTDELRGFLEDFEAQRSNIGRQLRNGLLTEADLTPEMLPYFHYNSVFRSPDNRASLQIMVNTLNLLAHNRGL